VLLFISLRGVAARGLVLAALLISATAMPVSAKSRWGKNYLPNVELVTQDGEPVRFYDDVLKDKIVLISFVYTTCRDICPLITARLAQVYEQLGAAAGRDIHFVSISIDPVNDTPAKLKEHAQAFRSDPNWVFLTGDPVRIGLVRHKLGERSRKLTEHGAQVMLYNDRTGEWSRDSAFADLGALTIAVRSMDPGWRVGAGRAVAAGREVGGPQGINANAPTDERPGQALFVKACASCHSIGQGDRVGPDLKDITSRRDRRWLVRFIRWPSKLHQEKDPAALALAAAYPRVRMPNLQVSEADVTDLLAYLDARSFAVAAPDAAGHEHSMHGAAHDHSAHVNHGRGQGSGSSSRQKH
jgi:protein SCO1